MHIHSSYCFFIWWSNLVTGAHTFLNVVKCIDYGGW